MTATAVTEARRAALAAEVDGVLARTPALDIHTHLYDPAMGGLLLWGIDELLVYHYLVAEFFRQTPLPYEQFWAMPKVTQAELIWQELFVEHSPLSEACRGVLTTLHRLGLEPHRSDLPGLRRWFAGQSTEAHVTRCLELANLRGVVMTNSPFDEAETPFWERQIARDQRFQAALRIDPLVLNWPETAPELARRGYDVAKGLSAHTYSETRRFLADWTRRLEARYLMVSLPPDFVFPGPQDGARLIEHAILPHCQEFGLPFALMPGVRRAVNPRLQLAGDGVGHSNLGAVAALCAGFPANRFLVTVLARENQHELCVLARKFRNLHIFGCWWFMNVPSLVEEVTRMRLELLGPSFTVQHSDARVLEQVVYKWDHSRRVLARVLTDQYATLAEAGYEPVRNRMEQDARELLGGAFERFCRG